jgi:hypothetical protein
MNAAAYARTVPPGPHRGWAPPDHRCTANLSPGGEHSSEQQVLLLDAGRIVATRYLRRGQQRGHVELRLVIPLPGGPDAAVAAWLRRLLSVVWAAVQGLARP